MIFPPVSIDGEYFGDGAMRQATPLSPAIHLGADRILVIGVRDETGHPSADPHHQQTFPSFAQIAGYMLDTLFMDGLYSDLERMIDTMVIVPSKDLRAIAYKHRRQMPLPVRGLLRGIGGKNESENRLLSFLMFEQAYTQELIALGYSDAMSERDQLLEFVSGGDVPRLFAPDWVTQDLSRFDA
jgi:NTE family protein